MITLLDIVVLSLVLFYAYLGWEAGIGSASIAALELLGCLVAAAILQEAIAGFLHSSVLSWVSSEISPAWSVCIAFAGVAWGGFAALRYRFHKIVAVNPEELDIDPLSDRIGGVIAGGIGGALFVGGVLMTVSMVPFLASFKPSRMQLDVGQLVYLVVGRFVADDYGGLPISVWGEPASAKSDKGALLGEEPWVDVDDDGEASESDRYRELDANDSFSKDLYFVDVDRDGRRRLGFVDKYVIGCWDDNYVRSTVRQRTDIKPDERKSKKKIKAGAEEPPPVIIPVPF